MQIGVVFFMLLLTRMLMLLYLFGSSGFLYSSSRVWPSICQILWWCFYYSLAINVISTFGLSIFWKTIRMIFLPFFTVFVRSSSWGNSNVTCTPSMKFWENSDSTRLCSYLFPTNRFTTLLWDNLLLALKNKKEKFAQSSNNCACWIQLAFSSTTFWSVRKWFLAWKKKVPKKVAEFLLPSRQLPSDILDLMRIPRRLIDQRVKFI